jgi:5-methylcytosine-specific restriction enzyme subunit McrC
MNPANSTITALKSGDVPPTGGVRKPGNDPEAGDVPKTGGGIPIRNLWYMLLYAWRELRMRERWRAEAESAPTLDALLASVLADLIQQRFRIGLGRDYRENEGLIRGIRGRVDFAHSVKRQSFRRGQAYCRFEVYSPNVPKNQIVRSTLARLAVVGAFGPAKKYAEELRHRLRRIVRDLDMADLVNLKPDLIRREQLQRHDADYRLMLSICRLAAERQMPTEAAGDESLRALDRDAMTLYRVYEKFVANFYKLRLKGWSVSSQSVLSWPATTPVRFLPALRPDLVMRCRRTGRMVVLDTKFTAWVVTKGAHGEPKFDSQHLYQIYAYLRSQEETSTDHATAAGILLYPTANYSVSEFVEMQGHRIGWETVDLAADWPMIEARLSAVPLRY